jgi:hypothetical protein
MSNLLTNNIGGNCIGPNFGSTSYSQLGSYNQGFGAGVRPPVPVTTTAGYYVVPAYSAPGYNTLTHGRTTGASYFTIGQAYGSDGGACNTQYMGSLCQ